MQGRYILVWSPRQTALNSTLAPYIAPLTVGFLLLEIKTDYFKVCSSSLQKIYQINGVPLSKGSS